jgi:integrase
MGQVYQRGSIRRVKRAKGSDIWEWRYRRKGKMKQSMFPVADFPTETSLWKHLSTSIRLLNDESGSALPVAVNMGTVIQRYLDEYLPNLSKSTQNTDGSMLRVHIEPKWGSVGISDVRAMAVDAWLKTLALSPASVGRARRMMKQLIDKAQFWEYIPVGVNPIKLVKVKGARSRQKRINLYTVEQTMGLIGELEEPYNLMLYVTASLGLRVEEVVALQWPDFDFTGKTLTISRAWTHAALGLPKSNASAATLPLPDTLIAALKTYRRRVKSDSVWVFPSNRTGDPRSADMILKDHIQPAAEKLKLPHVGWHSFRHSYRSWIGGGKASMSQQNDLMRHADIGTPAGYGGTPVEEMRPLVKAVAAKLRPKLKLKPRSRATP